MKPANKSVTGRSPRGFTLIELMIVVAILGILAVVAIPAFVRYMRVAKTAEAYRMLNKMITGAATYFVTPRFLPNGSRQPCSFPEGMSFVPARGVCCSDGEPDGKCEPNEDRWDTRGLKTMLFKISDKHYYSYAADTWPLPVRTKGLMAAAGDLDCDGTYSTFALRFQGLSAPDGISNCVFQRMGGFIVFNETE